MNSRLAALEAALEGLANEFARKLVEAALRAPVGELAAVLRDDLSRKPAFHPSVSAKRAPTRRPAGHRERPVDVVVEDADAFASVITDPSLLLDVIGSGAPVAQAATRASRSRATELIAPAMPAVDEEDQGPTLRPGERLQRTAGGSVVLRRGAK